MKPTIGIIGGCGPLATVDIEHKILKATQRIFHPLVDQDYFNLLVFNCTQISDRNDIIAFNQGSLFNEYLLCANTLISAGADILLVACQTAHVYTPALQNSTGALFLDIVQETAKYTSRIFPHISKVGLISTEATQRKKLYQEALTPYNIDVITVTSDIQKELMEAIYIIKTGINLIDGQVELPNYYHSAIKEERYSELKDHPYRSILLQRTFPNPIVTIKKAINYLSSMGCEHVILGCTELPLVLPHINIEEVKVELIDPNAILAESVVHLAGKLEQEKLRGVVLIEKMNQQKISRSN